MKRAAQLLAGLALALVASPAWACAVCFGNADSPVVEGVEMSVIFMVTITYTLIMGGLGGFLLLRIRARRRLQAEEAAGDTPMTPAVAGDVVTG